MDIPKSFTAIAEWMACLYYVILFWKFAKRKEAVIRLLISLFLLFAIQLFCGTVSNMLWILGMAMAVFLMYTNIKGSLGLTVREGICATARAFLHAEFIAALEWQVYSFYFPVESPYRIIFMLTSYVLYFLLAALIERKVMPGEIDKSLLSADSQFTLLVGTLAALFFAMSNLSYVYVGTTPFTGQDAREIFNVRMLFDFSGVVVLFAVNILKMERTYSSEMAAIRAVLQNQYVQYRYSQENIDIINRKYHDLKHQLQIIRMEEKSEQRDKYIDEIERGLQGYAADHKTGNAVLDTILTEKSLLCQKYDITMITIVDGALLNHIYVMDLCTIFGNALSNAIECEVQVSEKEKKLIRVQVTKKNQFISILIENHFEGTLKLKDGLPQTTKEDFENHGYGMKSIKYSVEKYGGHMQVLQQDEWFKLQIILPIK
jgi:hypothetical protein